MRVTSELSLNKPSKNHLETERDKSGSNAGVSLEYSLSYHERINFAFDKQSVVIQNMLHPNDTKPITLGTLLYVKHWNDKYGKRNAGSERCGIC